MVFPAPEGPTRAVSVPGSATKTTLVQGPFPGAGPAWGRSVLVRLCLQRLHRGEAFRPVALVAEGDVGELHLSSPGAKRLPGSTGSGMSVSRSSTSNTRSKETSEVANSTLELVIAGERPIELDEQGREHDDLPPISSSWRMTRSHPPRRQPPCLPLRPGPARRRNPGPPWLVSPRSPGRGRPRH